MSTKPAWGHANDRTIIERCDRPQRGVSISMLLTLKEASMAAGSPSMAVAWWSLLIGSIVVVTPAHATDHPARGLPPHARAAVAAYEANVSTHALAAAIPAFARKYGMKCSACHLAVPVLNQFGQAFKDNGYRMKN